MESMSVLLSTMRAFIVDVLGAFVPGSLFMLGLFLTGMYPFYLFWTTWENVLSDKFGQAVTKIINTIIADAAWSGNAVISITTFILAVIAYTVGVLFLGRSVDKVDTISYYYCKSKRKIFDSPVRPQEHSEGSSVGASKELEDFPYACIHRNVAKVSTWLAGRLPFRSGKHIEIPYDYIRDYMYKKGLPCCDSVVTWNGPPKKRGDRHAGNTEYFDTLKMRMQVRYPDNYHPIAYLEARNRLLASLYYAARAVWSAGWVSGVFFLTLFLALPWSFENCAGVLVVASIPLALMILACWIQKKILWILHPFRVRETVRVIDLAVLLGVIEDESAKGDIGWLELG